MVRRVSDNTSALGAGAPEVTMSANACSPGWLRSLEQFLLVVLRRCFPSSVVAPLSEVFQNTRSWLASGRIR